MRRTFFAALCGALLAISMRVNAQTTGQMILSKNINGPITRTSFELSLSANAECDQTQQLLPDGSRLSSLSFNLNADANGVGTFQGAAQIISPDGRTILQGQLRGTVGINTRCGVSRSCRLPWHLEGLFETAPSSYDRFSSRSGNEVKIPIMMLNFSADLNQQSASPLPMYQGRLDGLIPTLPAAAAKVAIAPDRAGYTVNEPISAVVFNGAEGAIQALDLKSYCTIVQLQIQNGNQWDDVGQCQLKRLAFPVNIPSNQRMEVPLLSSQLIPPPVAGTYRLALTFRFLENNIPIGDSYSAYSQSFAVNQTPPSNNIIVQAERNVYAEREPVIVKVSNDSEQPIVTMDHKSFCTILNVQKQQVNDWITIAPCLLSTPTRLVKINARDSLTMKLPVDDAGAKLDPGTYRLELVYFAVDAGGMPVGNPTTVYGRTFTVASKE